MGDFQASVVLPRPRDDLFNYMRDPRNLLKLFPESTTKHLDARLPEFLDAGESLELHFKVFGSQFHVIQQISDLLRPERIVATQLKGPFRKWVHQLRFEDAPEGGTRLTNAIHFEPPGGLLGFIVTSKQIVTYLDECLTDGHERLRRALAEQPA